MIKKCPICRLACQISVNGNEIKGNRCFRGEKYVRKLMSEEPQYVSGKVKLISVMQAHLPVISDRKVPLLYHAQILKALSDIEVNAPVNFHEIIYEDVCGSGANILSQKRIIK